MLFKFFVLAVGILHATCPVSSYVKVIGSKAYALVADSNHSNHAFSSAPKKHFPPDTVFYSLYSASYDKPDHMLMCGYKTSVGLEVLYGNMRAKNFAFDKAGTECNLFLAKLTNCAFHFKK